MSDHALTTLPTALRRRREQVGTRWRRLAVGRQALLVIAHLRKGETYTDLAAGSAPPPRRRPGVRPASATSPR